MAHGCREDGRVLHSGGGGGGEGEGISVFRQSLVVLPQTSLLH